MARDPAYARLISLLTAARKQAGLKQSEVAAKLGKPQSYVSKAELSERRLDAIEFASMAQAIGADPAKLLRAALKPPPKSNRVTGSPESDSFFRNAMSSCCLFSHSSRRVAVSS